jgi:hypothetical protein
MVSSRSILTSVGCTFKHCAEEFHDEIADLLETRLHVIRTLPIAVVAADYLRQFAKILTAKKLLYAEDPNGEYERTTTVESDSDKDGIRVANVPPLVDQRVGRSTQSGIGSWRRWSQGSSARRCTESTRAGTYSD